MSAQNDQTVVAPDDAFRFGQNWQRYIAEYLSPERERIASESLASLIDSDLTGKSFLDIGGGSGLFSLCAHKAGAREVITIDVDPDSVAASESLRHSAGDPEGWRVLRGSILDDNLVDQLPQADIVYSWGVLHHTGDMDHALRSAASLVAPGGLFCIAIYNRVTDHYLDSERWLRIKRRYNHSSRPVQVLMETAYTLYWLAGTLKARRNPFKVARDYKHSRGMALRTDLIDWLGGYPYEFATVDEIITKCEGEFGLKKLKVIPEHPMGTGNNQFVFERPAEPV